MWDSGQNYLCAIHQRALRWQAASSQIPPTGGTCALGTRAASPLLSVSRNASTPANSTAHPRSGPAKAAGSNWRTNRQNDMDLRGSTTCTFIPIPWPDREEAEQVRGSSIFGKAAFATTRTHHRLDTLNILSHRMRRPWPSAKIRMAAPSIPNPAASFTARPPSRSQPASGSTLLKLPRFVPHYPQSGDAEQLPDVVPFRYCELMPGTEKSPWNPPNNLRCRIRF